jgi:hypothetical protein
MAARNFYVPGNHAFNSNGLAVPGATATLYGSGTSTPKAFYSNSALSVSLGSTITANGIGRFPTAYGDDTVAYRLILKDKLGATLDDIDPFHFGQTIVTIDVNGATPQIDGALGDGVTDDHTALQAWLDRGGLLRLPVSEYYSSDNLILRKNAVIEGEGYGFDARIVDATADLGYDDQPGAKIRFAVGKGFQVQPQTTVTDVATAVAAGVGGFTQQGGAHSVIRNLALVGAGTGASVAGFYSRILVHLENVHVLKFQGKGLRPFGERHDAGRQFRIWRFERSHAEELPCGLQRQSRLPYPGHRRQRLHLHQLHRAAQWRVGIPRRKRAGEHLRRR